jgi:hypothetical protein
LEPPPAPDILERSSIDGGKAYIHEKKRYTFELKYLLGWGCEDEIWGFPGKILRAQDLNVKYCGIKTYCCDLNWLDGSLLGMSYG